ncbi:hypothetical protein OIU85_007439 [Salix viminalis]|uniref:Protein kinase domain-containing protein n=1 Tax=Salix viminalis TaxID=40686 RepID=A0A9Q0P9J8_SALVM|nr:hypothetical protein OIU85_007439 [Salix viminalis]
MGFCPCFGFSKSKKVNNDHIKKQPSYEQRLGTVSKKSVDSRIKSSAVKDGPSAHFSATLTYEELSFATSNFRSESLIGRGGFGSVFKGKLESTGQVVAVKQLDPSGIQGDEEFLAEVLMLSLMHHPNLVNLIGFCAEGDHRLLVYEYMPLGSLEDHLFDMALPLLRDHNFSRLADPMLKGKYSMSVLKKVIEVASMCLSENANSRPSSSELVQAMDFLFSRKNESKKVNNDCAKWPEIDFCPSHTKMILDKDLDRDRAVAEAKLWGVKWRERREEIQRSVSDEDNR